MIDTKTLSCVSWEKIFKSILEKKETSIGMISLAMSTMIGCKQKRGGLEGEVFELGKTISSQQAIHGFLEIAELC